MSDLPLVGRDGWRTVGIASASVFMVSMEITVISLAFPEIREQFSKAGVGAQLDLQCLQHRRRQPPSDRRLALGTLRPQTDLPDGVSIFLLGSVVAGFAVSSEMLIGARVVQAARRVAGALGSRPSPCRRPPARHQMAIGIWERLAPWPPQPARRSARCWSRRSVAGGVLDQHPDHWRGAGSWGRWLPGHPAIARYRRR